MMTLSLKRKSQAPTWKEWGNIDSAMDFTNGVEMLPSLDSPTRYLQGESQDSSSPASCTSPVEQPQCAPSELTPEQPPCSPGDLIPEETESCRPATGEVNAAGVDADKCQFECVACDNYNVSSTSSCMLLSQFAAPPLPGALDTENFLVLPRVEVIRNADPGSECYDYIYKIILIGNPSVGKTNLFTRFTQGEFKPNSQSTIGVDFATCFLQIDDCRKVKAQIWDSAGMELYRNICSVFYRSAVGVMVVYDVTDEDSFINLKHWHTELDKMCNQGTVRMLIGNKIDLETERSVSTIRGRNYAAERDMLFVETSALASQNVDTAFLEMFAHCDAKLAHSGARSGGEYLSFDDPMLNAGQGQAIRLEDRHQSHARSGGQRRQCCTR